MCACLKNFDFFSHELYLSTNLCYLRLLYFGHTNNAQLFRKHFFNEITRKVL